MRSDPWRRRRIEHAEMDPARKPNGDARPQRGRTSPPVVANVEDGPGLARVWIEAEVGELFAPHDGAHVVERAEGARGHLLACQPPVPPYQPPTTSSRSLDDIVSSLCSGTSCSITLETFFLFVRFDFFMTSVKSNRYAASSRAHSLEIGRSLRRDRSPVRIPAVAWREMQQVQSSGYFGDASARAAGDTVARMKSLVLTLGLVFVGCSGGSKAPAPSAPTGATGSAAETGSGSAQHIGECGTDADCGEGKRCNSCPKDCPSGSQVCSAVCGTPVCVPK